MGNKSDYVSLNFTNSLALLFIGLKLADIITWPWLWVTAPIWIPLAVPIVIGILTGIVIAVRGRKTEP
jgi:hypothetical protein